MPTAIPDIPEHIETDRLVIRPPRVTDVPLIVEAVHESLKDLKPWMVWATDTYSAEGCEENVREAIAEFVTRKELRYHFHDRQTGAFIAGSGFHALDWAVPKMEIGYWCRSSKSGQGYVSEGVTALKNLALKQFGAVRLQLLCDAQNKKSIAVALRCGFTLEGILKNEARAVNGDLRDTHVYAVTN